MYINAFRVLTGKMSTPSRNSERNASQHQYNIHYITLHYIEIF